MALWLENWVLNKELGGLLWLLAWWLGYSQFALWRAKNGAVCIASVLHKHRLHWMRCLLSRDNRIADAALLANLERNASFLASTTIFVIAGVFTLLASVDEVQTMVKAIPWVTVEADRLQLQFKIAILLLIHVYAFFTFTWSMRQYGFCAILLGGAPNQNADVEYAEAYVLHVAKVIDEAGISYNYGLRAFYFSLSVLAWLLNTPLFIGAVTLIVLVLYAREFRSGSLVNMLAALPKS